MQTHIFYLLVAACHTRKYAVEIFKDSLLFLYNGVKSSILRLELLIRSSIAPSPEAVSFALLRESVSLFSSLDISVSGPFNPISKHSPNAYCSQYCSCYQSPRADQGLKSIAHTNGYLTKSKCRRCSLSCCRCVNLLRKGITYCSRRADHLFLSEVPKYLRQRKARNPCEQMRQLMSS